VRERFRQRGKRRDRDLLGRGVPLEPEHIGRGAGTVKAAYADDAVLCADGHTVGHAALRRELLLLSPPVVAVRILHEYKEPIVHLAVAGSTAGQDEGVVVYSPERSDQMGRSFSGSRRQRQFGPLETPGRLVAFPGNCGYTGEQSAGHAKCGAFHSELP